MENTKGYKYLYRLDGDPKINVEVKNTSRKIWDDYYQTQLIHSMALAKQHDYFFGKDDAPMHRGPLHIDFLFVVRLIPYLRKVPPVGQLEDLIRYVNTISKNRLYLLNEVVSFTALKEQGPQHLEGYTEFTITLPEKEGVYEKIHKY